MNGFLIFLIFIGIMVLYVVFSVVYIYFFIPKNKQFYKDLIAIEWALKNKPWEKKNAIHKRKNK